MAVKLLEIPPEVEGVVVECGCYLGGSTANLSLACEIAGRELIVYDSFEGLPSPDPGDRYGIARPRAFCKADLDRCKENVQRHGAIDRCTFVKGFFADTLAHHDRPVVLCFLDVDLQASLHDCVINLWPLLTEKGLRVHRRVRALRLLRAVLLGAVLARALRHDAAGPARSRQRDRRRRVLPRALERDRRSARSRTRRASPTRGRTSAAIGTTTQGSPESRTAPLRHAALSSTCVRKTQ